MAVRFEFGLLGPLVVRCQGAVVRIAQGRQRALLAALLLDADRLLTTGQLIEVLWGAKPPTSARAALHNQVKRLRDALGESGGNRLGTQPGGYLIHLEPGELDVTRMQDLLASARAAARGSAWEQASALAAGAVLLWRGEPLTAVDSQLLAARIPQLTEVYLQAVETRLEAEVNLGRHAEVIGELRRLTAEQPFREHTHALLMLALYRCGRQGEALAAYQSARRLLVDELSSEPGLDLRALHRRILAADPALAPPGRENGSSAPAGSPATEPETAQPVGPDSMPEARVGAEPERARPETPHQLPAGVRHFAGRDDQLGELAGLLEEVGQPGRTVVISAIGGTAGIGKTALAVHWAHQVAGEFPDGQLYANLRGFDPSGRPVTAEAVVRDFLGALGVPLARIPASAEAQAALYRTVLARKRVLIVLDNARDADQVRLLLPGASGCFVLVTSRAQLVSLATSEGAHLLTLDLPSVGEARELLSRRLGAEVVAAEPEAADELIRLCARLPLALGIVSARAAASPGISLAALAAELAGTAGRLDVLDAGTPARGVRAAFSWSCRGLSSAAAWLFPLLGVHPGPDISAAGAASLAAMSRSAARSALRELTQAGLIAEQATGRFAVHDLVRIYAAEQAASGADAPHAGPSGSAATGSKADGALGRMLDHYLHTAREACLLLYPARDLGQVSPPLPGTVPEQLNDGKQALAWFDSERRVLLAVTALAARKRFDTHAWQLPSVLAAYLEREGHWYDYVACQRVALRAAEEAGDLAGQANASLLLGRACGRIGSYQDAQVHLRRALRLYGSLGDQAGQAHAHHSLGWMLGQQQRYRAALRHARLALSLYQAAHHRTGQARALNTVGWYGSLLGLHEQALTFCQQAAELHRELGNHDGEADAWDSLGHAHHYLGRPAEAVSCYQRALSLFQIVGDRLALAGTLGRLGDAHRIAGQPRQARDAWQQALNILTDLDHADAAAVQAKLAGLIAAS